MERAGAKSVCVIVASATPNDRPDCLGLHLLCEGPARFCIVRVVVRRVVMRTEDGLQACHITVWKSDLE